MSADDSALGQNLVGARDEERRARWARWGADTYERLLRGDLTAREYADAVKSGSPPPAPLVDRDTGDET